MDYKYTICDRVWVQIGKSLAQIALKVKAAHSLGK